MKEEGAHILRSDTCPLQPIEAQDYTPANSHNITARMYAPGQHVRQWGGPSLALRPKEWLNSCGSRALWGTSSVLLARETAGLRGTPALTLWKVVCAGSLETSTFTCVDRATEHSGRNMRASSIGSASNQAGYPAAFNKRQMYAACF